MKFNKIFTFFPKNAGCEHKKKDEQEHACVVLLLFVLFMRWACVTAYGVCACHRLWMFGLLRNLLSANDIETLGQGADAGASIAAVDGEDAVVGLGRGVVFDAAYARCAGSLHAHLVKEQTLDAHETERAVACACEAHLDVSPLAGSNCLGGDEIGVIIDLQIAALFIPCAGLES